MIATSSAVIIIVNNNSNNCYSNRRRKYSKDAAQQGRTVSMLWRLSVAAAIPSMYSLGAQPTASWDQLYAGFCRLGKKTGGIREKPSEQSREPTQLNPLMVPVSGNRTWATMVAPAP